MKQPASPCTPALVAAVAAIFFVGAAPMSGGCAEGSAASGSNSGGSGTGGGGSGGGGPFACSPGKGSCENGIAVLCNSQGTAETTFECDPVQGMVCDPDGCKGACSPALLGAGYFGCDYRPTVTLNAVWSGFPFAVAVVNTTNNTANVIITRGADMVVKDSLPPGNLKVLQLPWVSELKGEDWSAPSFIPPPPGNSRLVVDGAYRLRTDQPVTVYQFSPLSYSIVPAPADCPLNNGCFSFSNDASLLLPKNALSGRYTVLSWPSHPLNNPGFYAITAFEDNTIVNIAGMGAVAAGAGVDAAGNGKATLNEGDVLEVIAAPAPVDKIEYGADLTGTRISADKAIQVIGGHLCANVPSAGTSYCDHLEESLFPDQALGKDYLVSVPDGPSGDWPTVIRVLAVESNTKVQFDPSLLGESVISPGDKALEIIGAVQNVHIFADKPIIVAQYLMGSTAAAGGKQGDPSFALAVPSEQFRKNYMFIAPASYPLNFVNILAKTGAAVILDGVQVPLANFKTIGNSGFSAARVALMGQEIHSASSDLPFGIMSYGYGDYTSYMVAGGLDLNAIYVPEPF